MSSNIMGDRDESLDFILSFYPDVLHPYEFIAKSSAPKVKHKPIFGTLWQGYNLYII